MEVNPAQPQSLSPAGPRRTPACPVSTPLDNANPEKHRKISPPRTGARATCTRQRAPQTEKARNPRPDRAMMSSASTASAAVRVEKATSELLIGPDWTMNLDICDSVNSDHWQVKDVVKAVKKRLQNKNPKVQFLALTLLETMIKNCGEYVHSQVVERDILQEMVKIVKKKTDMQVRDKILVLLDSWQEAFGGPGGKYPQYYLAYIDLKRSGVQFPQRSPDSALIFTPPFSHTTPMHGHPRPAYGMPSSSVNLDEAMASEMSNLSIADLDGIGSVMELLSEMLRAVNPNDREAVKDELITDLVSQCRSNQKKLMELISSTGDEELLGKGLALNDNLQSVLAKHDAIASGSPLPAEPVEIPPRPSTPPTPVASAPMEINRFEENEEEEDDDFAQIARRNLKPKTESLPSTSAESGVYATSRNDTYATTDPNSTEASSSMAITTLALPEPPAPVKTVTKEEDMINLLSLTLTSNPSPPPTPPVTPPSSNQNIPPTSVFPNAEGHPYNPHPYTLNQGQGYNPYNGYVAPWAQTQPQPQPQPQLPPPRQPQVLSSYPPPPWEVPLPRNPNSFPSSVNSMVATAPASYAPPHASSSPQQYNPFGSGAANAAVTAGGTQVNLSTRQSAAPAAAKPFVLSNRLFEDLIELRNPDGSLKTGSSSPRFADPKRK